MNCKFVKVKRSLKDMLGKEYIQAVCEARSAVSGERRHDLMREASLKVDFFPLMFQHQLHRLMAKIGAQVCPAIAVTLHGASTRHFNAATKTSMAPLAGFGYFRVGEDGRLYAITKSEHYHTPLGHSFPGYALLEKAKKLGIPNATHNNTRGYITRLLEQFLVRVACPAETDDKGFPVLNRVLNLETGSLAVEAALKMILARFYKSQEDMSEPSYQGRIPVIVVVGNDKGGLQANYHGTTILTQVLRGMWSELYAKLEKEKIFMVRAVRPNNKDDLTKVFEKYDRGAYKIAAFFHEIVMMNYGAVLLEPDFLRLAYDLCKKSDAATVNDEIQSCLWHHDLFMFKEWKLCPTFLALGKGFSGGEYPASRIIFDSRYDNLPQFGALVTNGQEEIASLAYLITMAWAEANREVTRLLGDSFEQQIRDITAKHSSIVTSVNGKRHMVGIVFDELEPAKKFAAALNTVGIDISVQTYKTEIPPTALLKLPLIMDAAAIAGLMAHIDAALHIAESKGIIAR